MSPKENLKFKNYENCLEVTQLENKTHNNYKKNKPIVDSLQENHKQFIRNNKQILKSQQNFRSEKHSALTEKANKITLSAR